MTRWGRLFGASGKEDPAQSLDPAALDRLIVEGNALEDRGQYEAALAMYQQAARAAPAAARPHVNIGNALKLLGRTPEAIAAQRTAIRLDPGHAGAQCNLGGLLAAQGDLVAAEQALRSAVALDAGLASAGVLLAHVLVQQGRQSEAEAELRRVLASEPNEPTAAYNLGNLLLRSDRLDEAEDVLVAAGARDGGPAYLAGILGAIYSITGRLQDAERMFRRALATPELAHEVISPYLFSLLLRDDVTPADAYQQHRDLGARIEATVAPAPVRFASIPLGDRALRVGYVSPDFRQHPVGLFIRPVLSGHDRTRFAVHCYSNAASEDDLTRELRRSGCEWRVIRGIADEAAADLIRRDDIDILVDLAGHTTDTRLPLFARRPAPVQVTWLGYLGTTGLTAMDYRLCDRHTDPAPDAERLHTERLERLPHSQWCYRPCYDIAATPFPERTHPAVVFGSFNQYQKISDTCLRMWQRVLAQVQGSVLRIHGVPVGRTRDLLRARLARSDFDVSQVELHGRLPLLEYFQAIGEVDVALDSYPYNGATTTLDTLWMGVPLVALRGERAIARGSYSIMTTLGLPELIAADAPGYVAANVRLAGDRAWRRDLRTSLRGRLEASPLMDARAFVAALEESYVRMWNASCRAQA